MAGIRFQCSTCGQQLEAPPAAAECSLTCPVCQTQLQVPAAAAVPPGFASPSGPACPVCQTAIQPAEAQTACPACATMYHSDCWQENGGCGVYGCAEAPKIENRRTIEIPISYWGQENKPCPACGREILAAAVRCRHCGAKFSSARPEDADSFQERAAREERLPGLKRNAVWIFIFSVVPCLAPIGAIWGGIWYWRNHRDIRALPATFAALSKIGIAVAIGQCVLIALMALLYAIVRPD